MTDYIVPLLLLAASVLALRKQENAYNLLLDGAAEGLKLLLTLIPTLILLLTAVTMLRASGAMEWISRALSPVFSFFGIPPETAILVLIRPIMLGSTETTFYAISVYFGAAGVKNTRYTIPAALIADFTGFFMASLTAKIF